MGREHEEAALNELDTALSLLAARLAGELAEIGDEIERALGGREWTMARIPTPLIWRRRNFRLRATVVTR